MEDVEMKALVAYFSAEAGRTAAVAKNLAALVEGALYEIQPSVPYTAADLKWVNPFARCNREKMGGKDVPVEGSIGDFKEYDTIFIGFPIWYGCAPNVVNSFCKSYDWTGKKVYIFATSGGSGIGKTAEKLKPYISGAEVVDAKVVRNVNELKSWVE